MASKKQTDTALLARLTRERDVYKFQVAKMQAGYEEKIKELSIIKELGEMLRFINDLDTKAFWENQLSVLVRHLSFENATLMLLNQGSQLLEEVAFSGKPERSESLRKQETEATQQAFLTKQPVVVSGIPASAGRVAFDTVEAALACLPILHNKGCIGVLKLHRKEASGFEPNLLRFLNLVADGFATGIILARIYRQLVNEETQRITLSRFFPAQVKEKILNTKENLRLGGERKYVTILFADLQGFTSMSEKIDHEQVVNILNAYFSRMTPIIFSHNGTLDKLMGDGMLAVFGAPLSHEDDPYRAVQTAIEMVKALQGLNKAHRHKGWPELKLTVGINAGEVVAGYIGSEEHMNYTVIGDTVNVAQRIQSIAESNQILMSGSVRNLIGDGRCEIADLKGLNQLASRKLKGKENEIDIYEVQIDAVD
ncbi:MAG: adenylate/guanylate cyclase domain-containing protein [Desulfobacterales bacterium]|jgi:adenylate cyclase|nr:adenylate/guanylate cyclase domain-containing protein [Desulfobacterales bacterium]